MSYSIGTGIHELEEKLRAERVIAERFPDATLEKLCDGSSVWMAESAIEHTTDIVLVPFNPPDDTRSILVYSYLTVEGMRVYANKMWNPTHAILWVDKLKKEFPIAYTAMIVAARK